MEATVVTASNGVSALITFSDRKDDYTDIAKYTIGGSERGIYRWGAHNDLPQRREQLIRENNIVAQLISVKRDITLGSGLFSYRENLVDGKREIEEVERPKGAKEFFDRSKIETEYLKCAARNLFIHAMVPTQFRATKSEVISIKALQCKHTRKGKKDRSGKIKNHYWSGSWGTINESRDADQITDAKIFRTFDPKKIVDESIHWAMDDLIFDGVYADPVWWGDKDWIELSNKIPIFHKSNLLKGYNMRFHIEFPHDYFYDFELEEQGEDGKAKAVEAEAIARKAFLNDLEAALAGVENAGVTVSSMYKVNEHLGKEYSGIKITPIKFDMKDEALLTLFEKSNQANISAQGIHPTLANIETQGKLSSGSEIRNAFLMYLAIRTPMPRQILLEPINMVHKINKWGEGIKWGFRDIEVTKLDEDKSGTQNVIIE